MSGIEGSGMQGGMLMPQAANDLLTAFPDEMFENIADLERNIRFDPQNFWLDGGGVNTQVSLDALMAGMLGSEVLADEGRLAEPTPKGLTSKTANSDAPPSPDPDEITVTGTRERPEEIDFTDFFRGIVDDGGWECPLNSGPGGAWNLGLQWAGDYDLDGVPNANDADPFDPENTDIVVTATEGTESYDGGWTTLSNGTGTLQLFLNGNFYGYYVVSSLALRSSTEATNGTSGSLEGEASLTPGVRATIGASRTLTRSNGQEFVITRVTNPRWR